MIKAHKSQLKIYVEDTQSPTSLAMFYHRMTVPDVDTQEDEWEVDKVISHRKIGNNYEFLTQWKNTDERTWEPSRNFIHRYNADWVRYCKQHKIKLDVLEGLSTESTAHPVTMVTGGERSVTRKNRREIASLFSPVKQVDHPGTSASQQVWIGDAALLTDVRHKYYTRSLPGTLHVSQVRQVEHPDASPSA